MIPDQLVLLKFFIEISNPLPRDIAAVKPCALWNQISITGNGKTAEGAKSDMEYWIDFYDLGSRCWSISTKAEVETFKITWLFEKTLWYEATFTFCCDGSGN